MKISEKISALFHVCNTLRFNFTAEYGIYGGSSRQVWQEVEILNANGATAAGYKCSVTSRCM